jgi:dihydropteroate synthase
MINSRVEDTHFPKMNHLKVQDKLIDLKSPKIMGIVNITPDSFHKGSRIARKELLFHVEKMITNGASIIDIGGLSTRPGSALISVKEELDRTKDAVSTLKKQFPNVLISIDSFRSEVVQQAADEGVDIVNDISGFQFDPKLLDVVSSYRLAYILMHCPDSFEGMHNPIEHSDIFKRLIQYFAEKISILKSNNINDVVIDPGFGFGKTTEQNFALLRALDDFHMLERPLLVGISRKSMISKTLDVETSETLNGTTVLNTFAILKGASILRVHDVKEAFQIIQLLGYL